MPGSDSSKHLAESNINKQFHDALLGKTVLHERSLLSRNDSLSSSTYKRPHENATDTALSLLLPACIFSIAACLSRGKTMAGKAPKLDLYLREIPQSMHKDIKARITDRCLSIDYYNKVWPSARFAEQVKLNKSGDPAKVAKYQEMLSKQLKDMPGYSDYLKSELVIYQTPDSQHYAAAIAKHALSTGTQAAKSLDQVSRKLKLYAKEDLSKNTVLDEITNQVKRIHKMLMQ